MDTRELAEGIARELSDLTETWEATFIEEYRNWATIQGPGQASLHLKGTGYDLNESDRLKVSGTFPTYNHAQVIHISEYGDAEKWPSITCSIDRGPKAIAGDIRRRLLPEYLELLELAHRRIAEYKRDEAHIRDAAICIAEAFDRPESEIRWNVNGNVLPHPKFYVRGDVSGDVSGYGDSWTIELRSVPRDLAIEIGRLVTSR